MLNLNNSRDPNLIKKKANLEHHKKDQNFGRKSKPYSRSF